MKARLVAEHPTHYVLHDGKSPFPVPKAGLSEAMHARIKAMGARMAEGGGVETPDAGTSDAGVAEPTTWSTPLNVGDAGVPAPPAPAPLPFVPQPENGVAYPPTPSGPDPEKALVAKLRNEDEAAARQARFDAALPPGVRRAGDKAPEKRKAEPPKPEAPVQAKTGVPGVSRAEKDATAADTMAEDAVRARASAEAELARNQAAALAEQQRTLQQHALEQKELRDRARAASDEGMRRVREAQERVNGIDVSVDPGRFWATRGTAGKIGAILGLALGAVGAGTDGVNRAAGMLTQTIDRDIDAQKAEHELKLRKGGQALESARTLYDMQRQATGDGLAAHAATKAGMLESAELKAKEMAARAADPIAKANAVGLIAAIRQERAKTEAATQQRLFENHLQQQGLDLQRAHLQIAAMSAAAKSGASGLTAGTDALTELRKEWKEGGGRLGGVSQHLPGTSANDYNDTLRTRAIGIATQLNGGKMPKPATIDYVLSILPKPGMSEEDGKRQLDAVDQLLKHPTAAPGIEEERE